MVYSPCCRKELDTATMAPVPAWRGKRVCSSYSSSSFLPASPLSPCLPWVQSLGQDDPLEEEMAPHSSILAWIIPWTEEPGRLQSMGSERVRHN